MSQTKWVESLFLHHKNPHQFPVNMLASLNVIHHGIV